MEPAAADSKGFFQSAMASLATYLAEQRFKPFDANAELVPGIQASPRYGHTAGHTNFSIESKGQNMLLVGDLIHVGAALIQFPGLGHQDQKRVKRPVCQAKMATQTAMKQPVSAKAALIGRLRRFDGTHSGQR